MYALFDSNCAAPLDIKPAIVRDMASLAHRAMLIEVYTTPKPGLVDRANNGAHRDMTVETFERSANAIAPWLVQFTETGLNRVLLPVNQLLAVLGALLAANQAHYRGFAAAGRAHDGRHFAARHRQRYAAQHRTLAIAKVDVAQFDQRSRVGNGRKRHAVGRKKAPQTQPGAAQGAHHMMENPRAFG